MSDSSKKTIATIGHPTYPTVCELKNYKGSRYFDIRKHYIDFKTDELKPTRKGIMLNATTFGSLVNLLDKNSIDVLDWLNSGPLSNESDIKRKLEEASERIKKSLLEAKNFSHSTTSNVGGLFYDIKSTAGNSELVMNEEHPLYQELLDMNDQSKKIIMNIIMSFQHVIDMYDDQEINSSDLINDLKVTWSTVLANYINQNE